MDKLRGWGGIPVRNLNSEFVGFILLEIEKVWNARQMIFSSASNFGTSICYHITTPSEKSTIEINTNVAINRG